MLVFRTTRSLRIVPVSAGLAARAASGGGKRSDISKFTSNKKLIAWVNEQAKLCKPKDIHVMDGSEAEFRKLCEDMVAQKKLIKLNEKLRPGSYLAWSDPSDVARSEDQTFICCEKKEDAGPTNNWRDPKEMKGTLRKLFDGSMAGRTMYVVPFSMGPLGGALSHIGVEITDSPYVAASMRVMTRMGQPVLDTLGDGRFVQCMHTVATPLKPGQEDVMWPCSKKEKYITHFPETNEIWSYGSGYGGNSLLGKKSFALRIASTMGLKEGWLAEHMLILGVTNPEGKKHYVAAAFPSACGKTNFAMLKPTLPGWKVECVGDDIAWMKWGDDGRLYAINPENGFFGVAPGTSMSTNENAMRSIERDAIFTNVALTAEGDVWWEGMSKEVPKKMTTWLGATYNGTTVAAHPNSRFAAPVGGCPVIDPKFDDPRGVPISAIVFGGRRPTTIPLVYQCYNWLAGVVVGSAVSSVKTAAATGSDVGQIRHDPFAMLPFCGYNMADYFGHWIEMGQKPGTKHPLFFSVNWFRTNEKGKFIWPGFGENSRVLKWMFERIENVDNADVTPVGYVPKEGGLDIKGLKIDGEALHSLFEIDTEVWLKEVAEVREYMTMFGSRLPKGIADGLDIIERRLKAANYIVRQKEHKAKTQRRKALREALQELEEEEDKDKK